ncbi:Transcriptional regulator, AcrR-family (plasmid) [Leptospira biflexa serovar Patoc strain 'Patoc 1 (Ames)']|uniref:Putative transcriptional regulator, TetR family n=1 Tax=Leptospira biflexa serovar Patoc (strain Patoc 1 / ATCC 23582 / Paris) TaxID=456481 RepID=B0SUH5_LEPBP|nr:TetR/AcrR family transcriptional regulator [Leptospira biflexa]ABZ96133.1 Transcriptional regulator, AcrR-family [Leptospira biflexa serovar Patoc strain 'Patoc 1 (Ames)']ABZ99859.1 Putative transcriptional regulator, TetR family [Leptospira biflexa serovar Patoc strain 'Patoc 1 (Paris)']
MKEKITNQALRMLKKEGLKSLSMRKLAEHLSIDPMTIYYYFKNKDQLMAELVEVVFRKFYESLRLDEGIGNENPQKKLEFVLIEYRSFFIQYLDLSLYLIQSPRQEYPAVTMFNDRILDLILALKPYENPELTRDILVDFIHGNALSVSKGARTRSNVIANQNLTDQFKESFKILFNRLFYNTRLA